MAVDARNRLQPSLFDRLVDDRPDEQVEAESTRVMTKPQLRAAVLRDLRALLNAIQLPTNAPLPLVVAGSVLNYGLPPLAGQLAAKVDITSVADAIREAIVRFEPRIVAKTLAVRAVESETVLDTHNVIEFEIEGQLWSQPVPLEILLRTRLDLEAGQTVVTEAR